jgi:hypothetical protein
MIQERSDPVIDEIRDIRRRIAASVGDDPVQLVAYYMKLQEQHRERVIDSPHADKPTEQSPAIAI